jgi:hypothetical protein
MTVQLPHVPPGTYVANEVWDIGSDNPHIGFETRVHQNGPMVQGNFLELQPDGEVDVEFIGMAFEVRTSKSKNKEEQEVEKLEDDPQANGGVAVTPWKPTKWDETKLARTKV